MTFSITHLAESLAAYLAPTFPGVTFYTDPNQQDTQCPCMFLQKRYAYTERRRNVHGYYLRRIGVDLTYLEDYNLPNLQQLYDAAEEALAFAFDTTPAYCFRLTGGRLPMGCHSWSKRKMYRFWRRFIG